VAYLGIGANYAACLNHVRVAPILRAPCTKRSRRS
jgi:hypothetical protein